MFFLGISANIMIYLLVSAFLVVCCYFNGESENCEMTDNLMITTIFSPCEKELAAYETFFYGETVFQTEKTPKRKVYYIPQLSPDIFLLLTYTSLPEDNLHLRAPPSVNI